MFGSVWSLLQFIKEHYKEKDIIKKNIQDYSLYGYFLMRQIIDNEKFYKKKKIYVYSSVFP